jgi:hypothetical protein
LLRRQLATLLEAYPMLRLITGDAIFAQRPLLEVICGAGCDYLVQIEGNQGDTLEALTHCFTRATERAPAAQTIDKKGLSKNPGAWGLTWSTPIMSGNGSTCRDVA